jgi:drug/metabolite transporter (DMT)-like permease
MSLPRLRWMRLVAVVIAVAGVAVALSAYAPSEVCGGDPGACVRQPAAVYRLWTIVGSLALALGLLVVDSLLRVDDKD